MNSRLVGPSPRSEPERLWKLTWLPVLWKTSVTSMRTTKRLRRGLPQDLGKRFAFPTATLKTLRVSNKLPQPHDFIRSIRPFRKETLDLW